MLSALDQAPSRTQVELGKALGLDRTTLMAQLDRLERMGLVVRRGDPRDRRTRIPYRRPRGPALSHHWTSDLFLSEVAKPRRRDFRHDVVAESPHA